MSLRLNSILYSRKSVDWRTPEKLYAALNAEFHFDFDPCPIEATDGLIQSWAGKRVYCNPPYGPKTADFLRKAGEAEIAVFLVPSRTDTKWFHEIVLPRAKEIRFIKGRVHFNDKGPAPFPSMVVVFRHGGVLEPGMEGATQP
jgi:DNA N-6-adenine-methyltransferase Dam